VILVGEMRDLETAQMGIQASLTGHLVFSTLHTNDAPSAITRLIDMGVPAYLVASSVVAVMAQRLVRVVCQKCKTPYTPSEATLEAAGVSAEQAAKANFVKGRGCGHCQGSGYRGRLGIFELMLMTSRLRELTFNQAPTEEVRKTAIAEGMKTLYQDGIEKALKGITTIEEVLRTAKRSEHE
jgi:type IV pilus assembly protein PilB